MIDRVRKILKFTRKEVAFLVTFFVIHQAFGSEHSEPVPLTADRVDIHVLGLDIVDLELKIARPSPRLQKYPAVELQDQYAGFECTIESVSLFSSRFEGPNIVDVYRIKVSWQPGADISGCHISVTAPYSGMIHRAHLYMDY